MRFLDVIAKAVEEYTRAEQTRRAWDVFEREVNRLGYRQDPEAYCGVCAGEGERTDEQGRLDVCMRCDGNGFLGYPRTSVQRTPVPALYSPGDELLGPTF